MDAVKRTENVSSMTTATVYNFIFQSFSLPLFFVKVEGEKHLSNAFD